MNSNTILSALVLASAFVISSASASAQDYVETLNFESVPVPTGGFINGGPNTNSAGFTVGDVFFSNRFTRSGNFSFWSGYVFSSVTDSTTAGFGNQYAAYPGGGAGGSANYAVYFSSASALISLPTWRRFSSVDVANTTYTALSIRDGDSFAKKFGGPTGNDPDFFSVTFTGYPQANGSGAPTGTVTYVLADYRFTDNSLDYIRNDWNTLDLTPLGDALSLRISFASSDVGSFGINTPTYVALDNLVVVPEPAGLSLVLGGLLAQARRRRRAR